VNGEDYERLIGEFTASRRKIHSNRNERYAHDDDVLANIKRTATGSLTPLQVWMVYAAKHWDSICGLVDMLARGESPDPLIGEADVAGSFRDLANYIELGYALLLDQPMTDEEASSAVHDAAIVRLSEAYEYLAGTSDGDALCAPFCGCDTCLVREILDSAMPILRRHFG
jgi:hypothetical protein